MGVKGLWSLLNPVARPVQIESLEGKKLAIDSSIWLYQFQATMRDKDGRVLVNAHVLGFLRRINKLLFHGIKPVFVFDGGAPNLKRSTIAERKRRKQGAAANHAKTAEKLFAAQMRREAVKVTQAHREAQAARDEEAAMAAVAARYDDDRGEQIAENAVYLEDLEGQRRPAPQPFAPPASGSSKIIAPVMEPDPKEERRKKFRKHDPYKLPETSVPTMSTDAKPDARLATEAELKHFIDEMHPSDIDVESAEFRALPTEVQYEIIGDLRIRSRQQSHRRLADMLRAAPTALDFSMAQIKHLSQRNALTQQLLEVTDMVGHAHLTIPVRIAAERNREYVLVKRGESEGGGWALGIREGTKANPIQIEPDVGKRGERDSSDDDQSEDEDSDLDDVQEISPPPESRSSSHTQSRPITPTVDADLQEFRRKEALEAIAARYKSSGLSSIAYGQRKKVAPAPANIVPTANDEALALALQQEELGSDEEEADPELARALAISRLDKEMPQSPVHDLTDPEDAELQSQSPSQEPLEVSEERSSQKRAEESDEDLEEVSLEPSGRNTPMDLSVSELSPAELREDGAGRRHEFEEDDAGRPHEFEATDLLPTKIENPPPSTSVVLDKVDDALEELKAASEVPPPAKVPEVPAPPATTQVPMSRTEHQPPVSHLPAKAPPESAANKPSSASSGRRTQQPIASSSRTKQDVTVKANSPLSKSPLPAVQSPINVKPSIPSSAGKPSANERSLMTSTGQRAQEALSRQNRDESPDLDHDDDLPDEIRQQHRSTVDPFLAYAPRDDSDQESLHDLRPTRTRSRSMSSGRLEAEAVVQTDAEDEEQVEEEDRDPDESGSIQWSPSPSPAAASRSPLHTEQSAGSIPSEVEDDDVDMAPEEMAAEEDDYARFLASIKNRDLNEVRTEIDDEIRVLNAANKVAMRDSDEISQAMVAQIQTLLRHFGIPYITAPMEAEAQCAKLAELNLVDGIITDDSDVFLFGGKQCFKNIFNDAKYAECFLLADIDRELSLKRERLISLAYLLGSDYTIGLPGVGPVVALELLANFPGERGVDDFKSWWMKVQRGQDSEFETNTKWKKSFKKRYSSLIYLTNDWPNPLVREAYKYPTTDESEEPFHWGFPKLSALRAFLHEELSWSISKVDDELTPIVQRIARRGKVGALNKQATLDPFFDLSVASGNCAPRRRTTANVSKRLMAVIKDFRAAEARLSGGQVEGWGEMLAEVDEGNPKGVAYARKGSSQRLGRDSSRNSGVGLSVASGASDGTNGQNDEDKDLSEGETKKDGKGKAEGWAKKPAKRKRRKTVADGADVEAASKDEDDVKQDTEGEDGEEQYTKKPVAKKKKQHRGSRRWVGPRWDVVEKPDD